MICVEELFPDYTPAYRKRKPNLLVGIASNGWVDQTGTPQQRWGITLRRPLGPAAGRRRCPWAGCLTLARSG